MKKKLVLALFLLNIAGLNAQQNSGADKKEILKIVQSFFDGMEARDTAVMAKIALADAYHFFIRQSKDSVSIGSRPHSRFNQSLVTSKNIVKEKFRKTGVNVQIHKSIATVWGPYDLWINDKFSHCGVDVFTLLKTKDGWKIASLAFSAEPDGCDQGI